MARRREVGTLWIGGALSWLEQLCLTSFVEAGQAITLFSYEPIPNVPEGVILRDGREILETSDFLKYEKKDSYALFADLFRLHMIRRCPGMIWVDTDIYCHRLLDYEDGHVMGFELPDSPRVNNAVLGLPTDSPVLEAMLAFTADFFPVPSFLGPALQEEYRTARAAGAPVHVGRQPWGVWGPLMLTHFVKAFGLADRVQPLDAFYPVPFPDRLKLLRPASVAGALLSPRTTGLHLWASNKRELGLRHGGLPPEGSFLDLLVRRHRISPAAAPIAGRGRHRFEAGLVERLGPDPVEVLANVGGSAPALALAVWARWGAEIDLVDLDAKGRFPAAESAPVAAARAYLEGQGVPARAIRRVARAENLRPVAAIANLTGFGDTAKIRHLEPVLRACLRPGTRMILDIRKGSGAYPFLKDWGRCETLSIREEEGITRALFIAHAAAEEAVLEKAGPPVAQKGSPPTVRFGAASRSAVVLAAAAGMPNSVAPPPSPGTGTLAGEIRAAAALPNDEASPASAEDNWPSVARALAGPEGFLRDDGRHSFLFIPRGDVLVVTFDNLDIVTQKRKDRRPWGFSFIEKQGWSMLGVMANGWTWYRDPWVEAEFDRLAAEGFFTRFRRVVFYGASMGGYAALSFVAACPGADAVAISPQSTLDRALVPWETRYRKAWDRDFSGKYGDAARASAAAGQATILYDPYEPLDAAHTARFSGTNLRLLRAPLMGHRLGSSLNQMRVLSPIILAALDGSLTEAEFYRILRARRDFPRYQTELFRRALERGHEKLARKLARWVLARGANRAIRRRLREMDNHSHLSGSLHSPCGSSSAQGC
ncbi:hypothetical protein [Rhodobacter sp. NSM]|uniref:hypothetical protein n=1 Tax=Rhodobacter sp. NSM TaxID=3457501 RepID=UPI003FD4FBBC